MLSRSGVTLTLGVGSARDRRRTCCPTGASPSPSGPRKGDHKVGPVNINEWLKGDGGRSAPRGNTTPIPVRPVPGPGSLPATQPLGAGLGGARRARDGSRLLCKMVISWAGDVQGSSGETQVTTSLGAPSPGRVSFAGFQGESHSHPAPGGLVGRSQPAPGGRVGRSKACQGRQQAPQKNGHLLGWRCPRVLRGDASHHQSEGPIPWESLLCRIPRDRRQHTPNGV